MRKKRGRGENVARARWQNPISKPRRSLRALRSWSSYFRLILYSRCARDLRWRCPRQTACTRIAPAKRRWNSLMFGSWIIFLMSAVVSFGEALNARPVRSRGVLISSWRLG